MKRLYTYMGTYSFFNTQLERGKCDKDGCKSILGTNTTTVEQMRNGTHTWKFYLHKE